jgi:hypothetical protein
VDAGIGESSSNGGDDETGGGNWEGWSPEEFSDYLYSLNLKPLSQLRKWHQG